MKVHTTLFLKIALVIIGLSVFCLCLFWLPWISKESAELAPEFAFLRIPVLTGLYLTAVPFFFAILQSWKLLVFIEEKNAFSVKAVETLNYIKFSAIAIISVYIIGMFALVMFEALHPGIALIGIGIIFISVLVSLFASVLQQQVRNVQQIKAEQDLTV
ncbi:DUF2975 domain-containing protein [Bacillus sp. AK031]